MPRQSRSGNATRRRHSKEFKSEALALAEQVGVDEATAQLQLQPSQLYAWCLSTGRTEQRGKAEQEMAAENARLKRQLAEKGTGGGYPKKPSTGRRRSAPVVEETLLDPH